MAKNVLEKPVGVNKINLLDGLYITTATLAVNEAFNYVPFVDNGTYTSALVKLGGAVALSGVKDKRVQYVGTGMLISGALDGLRIVKGQAQDFIGMSNNKAQFEVVL